MSLWHKPTALIDFNDIESFCAQGRPEGPRLDYKSEIPNDLQKLVAAFANTLGGMIVLGVGADKSTNKPDWPPKGMPKVAGIEERITSICIDGIYPSVRPLISPVIKNPHAPDTVLAVLRVDESPEAPHAVGGHIYERISSQGKPYRLSEIDRIRYLLERRGRIEEQRSEIVRAELKRAVRQLAEIRFTLGVRAGLFPTAPDTKYPRGVPLRWASVIPAYPWRDLCSPEACFKSLGLFRSDVAPITRQRVPGGAFGRRRLVVGTGPSSADGACCSVSTKGHVFAMECAMEPVVHADLQLKPNQKLPDAPCIGLERTAEFVTGLLETATGFYQAPDVELPGYVMLAIGLVDVFGWQMTISVAPVGLGKGQTFLDDDFGADSALPVQQLLDSPENAAAPLLRDLKFGFDLYP